jgi:hypothetical protein
MNANDRPKAAVDQYTYTVYPASAVKPDRDGFLRISFPVDIAGEAIDATALVAPSGLVVDLQADSAGWPGRFTAGTTGSAAVDDAIRERCARLIAGARNLHAIKSSRPRARRPLRVCDLEAAA